MRSSTGRRLGPSRAYFRKPFGSAMGHQFLALLRLLLGRRRLSLRQHSFVIDRHDLDELRQHRLPGVEHQLRFAAAGVLVVRFDHLAQDLLVLGGDDLFQLDHAHVAARLELPVLVQDEGDPAGHPGREVPSGPAEDHDHPAGHVLAAVIAGAVDDSPRAAVADGKSIAGVHSSMSFQSMARSSPWSCFSTQYRATSDPTWGWARIAERSRTFAFQWSIAFWARSLSGRPIISANFRKPIFAIHSRTSSATKKK